MLLRADRTTGHSSGFPENVINSMQMSKDIFFFTPVATLYFLSLEIATVLEFKENHLVSC